MVEMPKKTPIRDMTPEQRRAYQNEWYERNKAKVQLARIAKGLANGERSVSIRTLEKYNVKPDENEKIVIKPTTKVRYVKEDVEDNFEVPTRVYVERPKKISQYEPSDTLNAIEIKRWVQLDFKYAQKKLGLDDVRADRTIATYATIPEKLFRIHNQQFDKLKDLTPWLSNTKEIINVIDKTDWADSTKGNFLGQLLQMYKSFPLMKTVMTRKTYDELDEQAILWSAKGKDAQEKKRKETLIYSYDVIRRAIKRFYGELTDETLLFDLYSEVIFRDDVGSILLVYKEADMSDPKGNYLLLNRKAGEYNSATIYMNSYKTKSTYGQTVFKLSSQLTKDIISMYPSKIVQKLFPLQKDKLSGYIIDSMQAIPLFKNEKNLGTRYLRHSVISTKLLKIKKTDPDYRMKTLKIASLAMHSGETQNRYVSPLKNASNKEIKTEEEVEKLEKKLQEDMQDKGDTSLIGKTISRRFKTGVFEGKVMSYSAPYYNIRYTDGDSEQFTLDELKKLLKKK